MEKTPSFGRLDAPYLLVMVAPLSKAQWRWIWDLLQDDCNIPQNDCRIVFMLDEQPEGAHYRPTQKQLDKNVVRFRSEMVASFPRVVIPFGPEAFRAITGLKVGIEDARGYVLGPEFRGRVIVSELMEVGKYKTNNKSRGYKVGDPKIKPVKIDKDPPLPTGFDGPVIPVYSHRQVEKSGYKLSFAFKMDLMRAAAACQAPVWSDILCDNEFTYETEVGKDFTSDILAFDFETMGNNSDVIDCISFSDGKRSCTLKWSPAVQDYTERQLAVKGRLFILHNMMFDRRILAVNGVCVPDDIQIFDSMLCAVVLQPDLPKGLGKVASLYLNCRPWKWRYLIEMNPAYYSAKDSFMTALLAIKEIEHLKTLGMWDLFMGGNGYPGPGEMKTIPTLMEMTANGVKVDLVIAKAYATRLRKHLLRLEKMWAKQFAPLNPASNPQLCKFFYKEWKLPIHRNKEDGITVDELACVNLRELVAERPKFRETPPWQNDERCTPRVFDLLLNIRFVSKELKTYAKVVPDDHSFIHPSYLPEAKDSETRDGKKRKGAAATGRLASSNPNFQNQSDGAKAMFIPDHSDWCFVSADFKSAELWCLAARSGDPQLKADLISGDLHERGAKDVGCERRTFKAVIFGTCYGAGARKISDTIKKDDGIFISEDECKRIQRGIARRYPILWGYRQYLADLCVNEGCVTNAFGRVRFFYGGSRDIPAAMDYDPQSTVADVLWCVLKPTRDAVTAIGGHMTATVHDQILAQCHKDNVPACVEAMRKAMQHIFDNIAPGFYLPVKFKVGAPGANWLELEKLAA